MAGVPDPSTLAAGLASLHGTRRVRIALSGGLDSRVLLHLAVAACQQGGWPLDALHVDHGLQAHSPDWARFCLELCEPDGIELTVHEAHLTEQSGQSVEALARRARYDFFREQLQAGDVLLMAQHADDQVETLLLQLMRGAGPRGLAAMPALAPLSEGRLYRPLLDVSRQALKAFAVEQGLAWVEDPSNADRRFDRNFLRHEVMPVLAGRFPGLLQTVGRSAGHCAEAASLLDELAVIDVRNASLASGLDWQTLCGLSDARLRNALRRVFHEAGLQAPGSLQLGAIVRDFRRAGADAQPQFCSQGFRLRLSRGVLQLSPMQAAIAPFAYEWADTRRALMIWELGIELNAETLAKAGITLPESVSLRVTSRRGGERIRVADGGVRRRLKSLFQEANVPMDERYRYPLIWHGDELIAVLGLAVDPRYRSCD